MMSTIFFINCVVTLPKHLGIKKVYCLPDCESFVKLVYKLRLSNEDDFEKSVSLIVYEQASDGTSNLLNKLDITSFEKLIKFHFPCLNLGVTDRKGVEDSFKRLELEDSRVKTRLQRMSNWMYSDRTESPCSLSVYSMYAHLCDTKKVDRSSKCALTEQLVSRVDFESILRSENMKSDDFYWNLVDTWEFCANSLTTLELIYCAKIIISQLCKNANIECLSNNRLILLLFHLESSYHQGNKFHNFKHGVDVMQATYQLCKKLSILPVESLLLCIAAIGHDVGHPGTNNNLLCNLNSPIASIYGNRSVLENFHNDIFIDIFEQHWPHFNQDLLIIKRSVIATDMALHTHYVDQIQSLKDFDNDLIPLIIKAADISNVTRPLLISAKWSILITHEFNECTQLQKVLTQETSDIDISSSDLIPDGSIELFDDLNLIISKYPAIPKGQLFFIDTFAESLFFGLCDKFKCLNFLKDNLQKNKKFWLEHC